MYFRQYWTKSRTADTPTHRYTRRLDQIVKDNLERDSETTKNDDVLQEECKTFGCGCLGTKIFGRGCLRTFEQKINNN